MDGSSEVKGGIERCDAFERGEERGGGGERGKRKGIPGKGGKKRKFPFLMKRNSRALQNLKKKLQVRRGGQNGRGRENGWAGPHSQPSVKK